MRHTRCGRKNKERIKGRGASRTNGKRSSTRRSVCQRRRQRQRRPANEDENKNRNKGTGPDEKQQTRKESVRSGEMAVPVTPQMIRLAVKHLHGKRVVVSSSLIANHLRQCYPVDSNWEALKKELDDKLEDAVSVGLVAKCGHDAYCLPTLRHQANSLKTDLTRFWEKYHVIFSR